MRVGVGSERSLLLDLAVLLKSVVLERLGEEISPIGMSLPPISHGRLERQNCFFRAGGLCFSFDGMLESFQSGLRLVGAPA